MDNGSRDLDAAACIREFVAQEILFSTDGFPYADDASFLQEGIIDSLGVMDLVGFVQETFGICVDQHEVVPDNFDSVRRLAGFVRRKLESGQRVS